MFRKFRICIIPLFICALVCAPNANAQYFVKKPKKPKVEQQKDMQKPEAQSGLIQEPPGFLGAGACSAEDLKEHQRFQDAMDVMSDMSLIGSKKYEDITKALDNEKVIKRMVELSFRCRHHTLQTNKQK